MDYKDFVVVALAIFGGLLGSTVGGIIGLLVGIIAGSGIGAVWAYESDLRKYKNQKESNIDD